MRENGTRGHRPAVAVLLAGLLALGAAPAAGGELLRADFENQTVGQPVGLRGAAYGEPAWFNGLCVNVIRDDVTGSRSLEMADTDTIPFPGMIRFDLPDDTGAGAYMIVSLRLAVREADDFFVLVTERGLGDIATFQFCKLLVHDDGSLAVTDQAHTTETAVGSLTPGASVTVTLRFHLATDTYDVLLDGQPALADRAHGATDLLPGSIWLGVEGDADVLGVVDFDDLVVTRDAVGNRPASWGGVKARYR